MTAIVMVIDGVLRHPFGNIPIPEGIRLYHSFVAQYPVALISDDTNISKVNHWLTQQGIKGFTHLLISQESDPTNIGERRRIHLNRLRSNGVTDTILLVDSNPLAIEACYSVGITGLLFCSPSYAEPNHRPDYDGKTKPWNILVNEMTKQEQMYRNDYRLVSEV
jgi:hypothetical protein